ncbi:g5001 [Coccomyxa viridis]|uniref:G5001 protein n=1 Tax=Coccomyxa viridis TaxID=1274662 RepID=A0ABP1FRP5_9CHLO
MWVLPAAHAGIKPFSQETSRSSVTGQSWSPTRCRAPSHMQIRHASCEHGNSCSHALQQQMRHATQPFSMHRSSRAALPRSAHSSMQDQYLPLALLTGMIVGYGLPGPGLAAADIGLQSLTTTGIFVISGLGLKRGEALRALSAWGAIAFGFASILFITPLAALAVQRLPLGSPELTLGLAVFCCMPTTLSSGVSLTQAVGGNTALALLLTVGTNLAGIFTMPFMLCWLLDTGNSAVALSPGPLLQSLVKTILVPLLIGAGARAFIPGVIKTVDSNKKALSVLSASLLALVPWMQISKAVSADVSVSLASLGAVVACGGVIHLAYLAFNMTAVRVLGIGGKDKDASEGERRAVVLVGSQKTLPIAVTVLGQLSAILPGPMGIAVIPCVVSHLSQILMDSFLVSWTKFQSTQLFTSYPPGPWHTKGSYPGDKPEDPDSGNACLGGSGICFIRNSEA